MRLRPQAAFSPRHTVDVAIDAGSERCVSWIPSFAGMTKWGGAVFSNFHLKLAVPDPPTLLPLTGERRLGNHYRMKVPPVVLTITLLLLSAAGGWQAHNLWATERCLDAGAAWNDALGICNLRDASDTQVIAEIPFVRDAMKRWAAKSDTTVESVMIGRTIELAIFPEKECVKFVVDAPGLGEAPTYCYQRRPIELVEEHSNVE